MTEIKISWKVQKFLVKELRKRLSNFLPEKYKGEVKWMIYKPVALSVP